MGKRQEEKISDLTLSPKGERGTERIKDGPAEKIFFGLLMEYFIILL